MGFEIVLGFLFLTGCSTQFLSRLNTLRHLKQELGKDSLLDQHYVLCGFFLVLLLFFQGLVVGGIFCVNQKTFMARLECDKGFQKLAKKVYCWQFKTWMKPRLARLAVFVSVGAIGANNC